MKRVDKVISNWHVLIDDFSTSGMEFYERVEEAIRAREVPGVTFSRHEFKEGGVASAKRQYLRVERDFVAFDICAAPYGTGYFFSWWMTRLGPKHPIVSLAIIAGIVTLFTLFAMAFVPEAQKVYGALIAVPLSLYGLGYLVRERIIGPEEHVIMLPVLGWLYDKVFNPTTYYSLDTAHMFQESVRKAVNEVIDATLTDRGLKALKEQEEVPSMRALAEPAES